MSQNLKLPPQNIEAEESVLGALMIDKDALVRVADLLKPEDFYKPTHGKIYEAILKLFERNQPIDILTVSAQLKDEGSFSEIGGPAYLATLINTVPTASHVAHYAGIVREKKILRDLISASIEITESAFRQTNPIDETLDEIEKKIFSISQNSISQKFVHIKGELSAAYERIERMHRGEGKIRGLGTGYPGLDNLLSGFQQSDMIVVGARPSLGKTSLVLAMARHVAVKEKQPVGIFSLEMSREQVIDRLIAAEAQVPLWKLRTGGIHAESDFELIQNSLNTLSEAPIFIDDSSSPNILQIRSMARRLQMEHGLAMLIVDYLQLIQPRGSTDNVVQQITEISRGLKGIARELKIPVLAVSQLSRNVDQREVKVPRLSDLRESGSIEQDADVVMFIYRKDRDKLSVNPEEENMAEVMVAKHRNGPLGTVKLKFDAEKATFLTIDDRHHNS